eukprot:6051397-Amphidinium_carterae.1
MGPQLKDDTGIFHHRCQLQVGVRSSMESHVMHPWPIKNFESLLFDRYPTLCAPDECGDHHNHVNDKPKDESMKLQQQRWNREG